MQNNNNKQKISNTHHNESDTSYFHGAAIIDEQGVEILITEEMIQDSLKAILFACSSHSESK